MATFAKYVAPQVQRTDWGAITRGLSTGLQEVYKDREQQKADLDKLEMDAAAEVNNTEMGKSQTFNEFTLKGINTTKEYMASQNKLLKQGLITPAQYKLNILRAQEGWQTFAKNAETFNQDYAEFLERYDKGEASALEAFAREQYFSLTDINNKQIYVNPVDGNVYIAKVDPETGQVITDGLMDVKTINNALNQKSSKLDLQGQAKQYVDRLGKFAGVDPATGKYVLSGIDEAKRKEYVTQIAGGILSSDKAISSVLLDNMFDQYGNSMFNAVSAEQYKSLSPEEKKKSIIVKTNAEGVFVPELTEENRQAAREYTESVINSMISRQEKDPEEARRWEEEMKLRRRQTAASERAAAAQGGDDSKYAIERARNLTGLITDRTKYGNLVISGSHPTYGTLKDYTIDQGGKVSFSFIDKNGATRSFERNKRDATNIFNEILNVGAPGTTEKQRNIPIEDVNPMLSGIPGDIAVDLTSITGSFMKKYQEEAAEKLEALLGPLGFVVEPTGVLAGDEVRITTPALGKNKNQYSETFEFDSNDPDEAKRLRKWINDWVSDYNKNFDSGQQASSTTTTNPNRADNL